MPRPAARLLRGSGFLLFLKLPLGLLLLVFSFDSPT